VQDREGQLGRGEGQLREVEQNGGVFAAGEEQAGTPHLGGHLADDEHALGFQGRQLAHRPASVRHLVLLGGSAGVGAQARSGWCAFRRLGQDTLSPIGVR
jgi:hypothetical protein